MRILVTGGTGSVGSTVIKHILNTYEFVEIVCFSRDELKQFEMQTEINDQRLWFAIGDVRDQESVFRAAKDCDWIIHTAALKHVATGENYPFEVVKTNIIGTKNVADAAERYGAKMVLVSTDKAVEPVNLYGATKMIAEYYVLHLGLSVVRFGNIFGSRGSVLHKFKEWCETGHTFRITDKRMTRFIITKEQAAKFIIESLCKGPGIYIPDLKAMRIVDLAYAFDQNAIIEEMGIMKGEKYHESLEPGRNSADAEMLTIDDIRGLIDETL